MRNRSRNTERPGTIALARDVVMEYPRQSLATFMGVTAVCAVFINALFLQKAPHPAPLFAPKPAPVKVAPVPPEATTFAPVARPVVTAAPMPAPVAAPAPAKKDPIADMIAAPKAAVPMPKTAPAAAKAAPAPVAIAPLTVEPANRRVMAAQRALSEWGFGQIKPTGTLGPETRAAVERFERQRGLPVTGQLSDPVLRELSQLTGRKID